MGARVAENYPQGWMLAIDTSALTASIALLSADDPAEACTELVWTAGRNQTATLLGQVDAQLRLAGISTEDLGAVAVAIGPGSFNALRVGLSVAKSLAFAHAIPIFGVGTLEAAARSFEGLGFPVRAFVDAGRERVVVGDFELRGDVLVARGELEHRLRPDLADGLIEPTILAGDLPEALADELATNACVVAVNPALRRRRASSLIDLAIPRWRANDADDLVSLQPVYIHSRPQQQRSGKRSR